MSRYDLTCHNYSLVVQYRCNDSVYRCSLYICPEKVQGGGGIGVSTSLIAPQRPQHQTVLSTCN